MSEESSPFGQSRRKFMSVWMGGLALSPLVLKPAISVAGSAANQQGWTVQQVIDLIVKAVPNSPFPQTVDTIKAGSGDQKITGIVTTMFATCEVITEAAKLGANFIIAHEPTFYSHTDVTDWLSNSDVYQYKLDLLNKNKMTVWRCHDYVHSLRPDGVMEGVLKQLDWKKYSDANMPGLLSMPPASLEKLIAEMKSKLGIAELRYIGDPAQVVKKVALMPGAAGGRAQISVIRNANPDLLVVGEISEWETAEYVRDARFMGKPTALVVLGHALSEEPGSEWMAGWLGPQLTGIPIHHIAAKNPLRFA